MRDKTYIMAFLIATCCMLLGGLTVTGVEIYQYTDTRSESSSSTSQESAEEQPKQSSSDSEEATPEPDEPEDTEE